MISPFKSIAVLVVEDEVFLSKVLAERLQDEGFGRVEVAINGEEALQKMRHQPPDIILLDMILPIKNGFTVLQEMRTDDKLKQIPVMVLSNLSQEHDVTRAKKLGAAAYLVKSNFTLQKVVDTLRKILNP